MNRSPRVLVPALAVLLAVSLGAVAVGVGAVPAGADVASADAEGEVLAIEHDDAAEPDGEIDVTVHTRSSAGTVVEFDPDGLEVEPASDDAVGTDGNRVEFLDAGAGNSTHEIALDVDGGSDGDQIEVAAWVNGEDRSDADAVETSVVDVEDGSQDEAAVTALDAPANVMPGSTLSVTVETAASAGTVVEFDADGFDVDPSSDDAVKTEDGRVEFLDVEAGDSSYAIDAELDGASSGDSFEVAAWVNGETKAAADDASETTVTVVSGSDESDVGVAVDGVEDAVVDEPVNVTAVVTNDGDESETVSLDLVVGNDTVDATNATVAANGSETVALTWTPTSDDAGEQELTVTSSYDDATENLTVATAEEDEEDDGDDSGGGSIGIPGGSDDDPDDDEGSEDSDDDSEDSDDGSEDSDDEDTTGEEGSEEPGEGSDAADDRDDEENATPNDDADESGSSDDSVPGFGILSAIAGLLALLALKGRAGFGSEVSE